MATEQALLQATPVVSVQVCSRCGCRDTPQWRRHETMLLCNACGIKLARQLRKVQQQEEGIAPPRKAHKASHGSSAHQRSLSGETPVPSTPAARRAAARQPLPAAGATAALFPLQAWQQQQQQQQQLAAAAAAAAATAAAGAAVQLLPPQQLQAAAAAGELAPGVLIRHASTITDLLGGAFELWDFEVPALRPSDDTGAGLDELNLFNGGGASGSGSGGPGQPGVQAEVAENGGLQGLALPSPQQQAAWPRANSGNQDAEVSSAAAAGSAPGNSAGASGAAAASNDAAGSAPCIMAPPTSRPKKGQQSQEGEASARQQPRAKPKRAYNRRRPNQSLDQSQSLPLPAQQDPSGTYLPPVRSLSPSTGARPRLGESQPYPQSHHEPSDYSHERRYTQPQQQYDSCPAGARGPQAQQLPRPEQCQQQAVQQQYIPEHQQYRQQHLARPEQCYQQPAPLLQQQQQQRCPQQEQSYHKSQQQRQQQQELAPALARRWASGDLQPAYSTPAVGAQDPLGPLTINTNTNTGRSSYSHLGSAEAQRSGERGGTAGGGGGNGAAGPAAWEALAPKLHTLTDAEAASIPEPLSRVLSSGSVGGGCAYGGGAAAAPQRGRLPSDPLPGRAVKTLASLPDVSLLFQSSAGPQGLQMYHVYPGLTCTLQLVCVGEPGGMEGEGGVRLTTRASLRNEVSDVVVTFRDDVHPEEACVLPHMVRGCAAWDSGEGWLVLFDELGQLQQFAGAINQASKMLGGQ